MIDDDDKTPTMPQTIETAAKMLQQLLTQEDGSGPIVGTSPEGIFVYWTSDCGPKLTSLQLTSVMGYPVIYVDVSTIVTGQEG